MTIRVYVAAAILLGINLVAYALKDRGMPTERASLEMKIQELPRQFGSWTAEDRTLDPRVFKAIGAEMAIDRRYQDTKKNIVDLHTAVFTEYGVRIPHPPEMCYGGAGFRVTDTKTLDLRQDGSAGPPVQLLTLENPQGQTIYCLYWYQIGDATFFTGDGQRKQVRSLRGRTTWPPMIKVMLQTVATTPTEAEERLKALAAPVFAWTKEFH
ncbi:MAG: exosortase-associated EpsI family protein [Thermoguttaceae bacterium]